MAILYVCGRESLYGMACREASAAIHPFATTIACRAFTSPAAQIAFYEMNQEVGKHADSHAFQHESRTPNPMSNSTLRDNAWPLLL